MNSWCRPSRDRGGGSGARSCTSGNPCSRRQGERSRCARCPGYISRGSWSSRRRYLVTARFEDTSEHACLQRQADKCNLGVHLEVQVKVDGESDCVKPKLVFPESFFILVERTVVRIDASHMLSLEKTPNLWKSIFTGTLPTRRLKGLPSPSSHDNLGCERRAGQRCCRARR
jgi:hypothetical protein